MLLALMHIKRSVAMAWGPTAGIASTAKQSSAARRKTWIASSLRSSQ
jgi:hypothetical protein